MRQRSLQNGRHGFAGEYSVRVPQRGQRTIFTNCKM
jgi:hypothetical protein